jgi:hypothetical protein
VEAEAFLRRFLLHVLPTRFVRIRHYGWLANSARTRLLPTVREVLDLSAPVACTPPPARARDVGGHVAPPDGEGRHPLSVLRGGGIPHRRSSTGTSETGRLPTPRQKPVTDPARPLMAMVATPEAPTPPHRCVRRFPRARRASPARSGITLSRPRPRNLPSPGPGAAATVPLSRPPAHHQSP